MNFLKIFLFLTSFLLASIPASAEAKNINFTSSETKPYFFIQQRNQELPLMLTLPPATIDPDQ
ncbi:hypothetical protein [uncultured Gammaproteobacteria bacterium]|jgi:hypothetical protein|nr:hypothetical protein [uncultured Gammaproteobacteria bacterium]